MLSRIRDWLLRPLIEARAKHNASLIEAVEEAFRARDMAMKLTRSENVMFRAQASKFGKEWNALCRRLGLPTPCSFDTVANLMTAKLGEPADHATPPE